MSVDDDVVESDGHVASMRGTMDCLSLTRSLLPLTDRWHRKERRGDESGGCYALDGEVGDDLGALSDGDHRTRADQLMALCVSSQPASFSI